MTLDKNKLVVNALENIRKKHESIAVVGLGYVGLPLALTFAENEFSVIGIDVDQQKIKKLRNSESYLKHINNARISRTIETKKLIPTLDFSEAKKCMAIILCVPTPLNKNREPDLTYVSNTLNSLKNFLRKGQLLSLESTTYPGTTEEILQPKLESLGFKVGEDIFLAFSPERVDPGNKLYNTKNTPKVVGGVTKECTKLACSVYNHSIDSTVPVSSPRAAELVKLYENTFRSVNIAMANEMALIANKLDIDVWEVIEAAATKPFGFMPFYPGPGLGGHCIPIDPSYLSWKMKSLNYDARFVALAEQINTSMPNYVVKKVGLALNSQKKAINGSNVLILGVAYKPNINDVRESPALDVIKNLTRFGANITYNDNFIPKIAITSDLSLSSKSISDINYSDYDCIAILTDHSYFKIDQIVDESPLVVDTRNATKTISSSKIFKI